MYLFLYILKCNLFFWWYKLALFYEADWSHAVLLFSELCHDATNTAGQSGSCDDKTEFSASLLQSSESHDPSEVSLIFSAEVHFFLLLLW